ncbi:MAG: hypothetical protein A3F40_04520 [Chlamydiae bacterium RIFCSPHIGHO2_12_FULL_27_8]|nr:MAG: hypothetical protein A3F40_04520 [Chlamydiae bacterium RIFCSPHIGHO2_12_FULL_27_8]
MKILILFYSQIKFMENKTKNLQNKKIIIYVFSIHLLIILFLIIPFSFNKKIKYSPIKERTIVINKETVKKLPAIQNIKPIAKKELQKKTISKIEAVKKEIPKKTITKKDISVKKEENKIISSLEEKLKKIESLENKETVSSNLVIPKIIDNLNFEKIEILSQHQNFQDILITHLKNNLKLPDYGEVKISFVIRKDGSISNINILDSKSKINENYLKNNLLGLTFNALIDQIKNDEEFVIKFKNE